MWSHPNHPKHEHIFRECRVILYVRMYMYIRTYNAGLQYTPYVIMYNILEIESIHTHTHTHRHTYTYTYIIDDLWPLIGIQINTN